jgi:hypothetical protein
VSNMSSAFDFSCRLGSGACSSMANFSLHPSPRVSR